MQVLSMHLNNYFVYLDDITQFEKILFFEKFKLHKLKLYTRKQKLQTIK
jgi:hypothetical protein